MSWFESKFWEAFWVMSWFESKFWKVIWVLSRFESNSRKPFWVMSWFESIFESHCESWVEAESKLCETELNQIGKIWVGPMSADLRGHNGLKVCRYGLLASGRVYDKLSEIRKGQYISWSIWQGMILMWKSSISFGANGLSKYR